VQEFGDPAEVAVQETCNPEKSKPLLNQPKFEYTKNKLPFDYRPRMH
jgi:hypothetical protein